MRIFGLAAFVAASLSVPVSAQTSGELGKDVDAIAAHFSDTPIIGMTIAVSRGGRIVFIRGYGHSDLASGTAAGPDTVYEIGSITKEFTAAAILRLVERGSGLLAYSLVRSPPFSGRGESALVPAKWHRPLRQRMALLKGAGQVARHFYHFIQQPPARAILRRYGFGPPDGS